MSVFNRYSVAVVTPFASSQSQPHNDADTKEFSQCVDFNLLDSTIQHVAEALRKVKTTAEKSGNSLIDGVAGCIIVCGTTGEQHSISEAEKEQVYAVAVQSAELHQVQVAAGVSATSTNSAVRLARAAVRVGCAGIMLGLPPYLTLSDREILTYVRAVKAAVPLEMPVLLYNNCARNGYGISAEGAAELFNNGEIVGVKHASAPMPKFFADCEKMLQLSPNMKLYTGRDTLVMSVLESSYRSEELPKFYGLTSMLGNIYPEMIGMFMLDLLSSPKQAGEPREFGVVTGRKMVDVQDFLEKMADAAMTQCTVPSGIKFAMNVAGIDGGVARSPILPLTTEQQQRIEDVMSNNNVVCHTLKR